MDIKVNLSKINDKMKQSVMKSNRNIDEIKLIAVTKTIALEKIQEAIDCGQVIIGENKIQEAQDKYKTLGNSVKWHFIGHLQKNKAKFAVKIFDVIHSVDSVKLLNTIEKELEKNNIDKIEILLQFNTSGEESKFGVSPDDWESFAREISEASNRTKIIGLMTIGPNINEEMAIRKSFIELRNLRDKINSLKLKNFDLKELSMGMSGDFEIAIEEGATMVRVGSAIFGERSYN